MYVVLLIFRFFDDQPFLLEADFFIYLTILMLRRNIPAMGGNTMPADALAPKVARASAGMVLAL